jgi:hypothetical protein
MQGQWEAARGWNTARFLGAKYDFTNRRVPAICVVSKTQNKTTMPKHDLVLRASDGSWVASEIKTLNKGAAKASKTKASARAFLHKHGFVTKAGKLTSAYKG